MYYSNCTDYFSIHVNVYAKKSWKHTCSGFESVTPHYMKYARIWVFTDRILPYKERFCPYKGEYGSVKTRILAYLMQCHWMFQPIEKLRNNLMIATRSFVLWYSTFRKKCLYSEFFWFIFSRIWTEYGLEILQIRTLFT